ncbi:MAG: hypothetical protein ACMUEL_01450 [Flavobacteriales bacterium Tduv]
MQRYHIKQSFLSVPPRIKRITRVVDKKKKSFLLNRETGKAMYS